MNGHSLVTLAVIWFVQRLRLYLSLISISAYLTSRPASKATIGPGPYARPAIVEPNNIYAI